MRKLIGFALPVLLAFMLLLPGCKEVTETIVEDIKQSILDQINPFHSFRNPLLKEQYGPDEDIVKIARFLNNAWQNALQTVKITVQPQQSSGWGMFRSWSGRVEIKAFGSDKWTPVRDGMDIATGDTLRTLDGGKANIRFQYDYGGKSIFGGERILTIDGDSSIQAPMWEPTIDRKSGLTEENVLKALQLIKGRIWLFVDEMQHPSFYIKTPNAIAGVKGTEFEVIVDNGGNSTFNVIAGVVEVSDINMTRTVTLNAGQTSTVPPKGTPTAPKSFDAKSLNRWWETPYPVNAEEIAQINNIITFGWILAFVLMMLAIFLILRKRRKTIKGG